MHVNFVINFLCCSSKFVRCLVYAFECNAIGKERCLKNFCVCYVRTYLDAFAIALVGSRRTYARRQHRHTYTHVLPSPVSFVWVSVSLSLSLLFSFSPATITENHWIHTHTRVRNFDFRYTFWCCFQQYISDDIIQYAIATNRQRASSRKSNTIFYSVRKMKTRKIETIESMTGVRARVGTHRIVSGIFLMIGVCFYPFEAFFFFSVVQFDYCQ